MPGLFYFGELIFYKKSELVLCAAFNGEILRENPGITPIRLFGLLPKATNRVARAGMAGAWRPNSAYLGRFQFSAAVSPCLNPS
jgi:hypothetical protein